MAGQNSTVVRWARQLLRLSRLNCEQFQRLRLKLEICQLHTLLCIVKFYFCTLLVIVNVCSVTCLDNYYDWAECSLQIHNLFLLLNLALFEFGHEDAFGLNLFCWQSIYSAETGVLKTKTMPRAFVMTLVNGYRIFNSFKLTCHCQFDELMSLNIRILHVHGYFVLNPQVQVFGHKTAC